MAWLGKVSLGGFPDLAGAVTKLSESVKNIEKNFDSALGFEEKTDEGEASGLWPSSTDRKALFEPVMAFMGQTGGDGVTESSEKVDSSEHSSPVQEQEGTEIAMVPPSDTEQIASAKKEADMVLPFANEQIAAAEKTNEAVKWMEENGYPQSEEGLSNVVAVSGEVDSHQLPVKMETAIENVEKMDVEEKGSFNSRQQKESSELGSGEESLPVEGNLRAHEVKQVKNDVLPVPDESLSVTNLHENPDEQKAAEDSSEGASLSQVEASDDRPDMVEVPIPVPSCIGTEEAESSSEIFHPVANFIAEFVSDDSDLPINTIEANQQTSEQRLSLGSNLSDSVDPIVETENVKMEMKMMEAALQGAARQAQAKADEITKLMTENDQLKAVIEDLKRKSNESEMESLREEFHQKVAALERKVYALTKERDTLRREQSRKSDAAALLKEKDEIINQVMAEGEELSKKQASQESQIRKLRAQIREFEEEKKSLITKLQVEESKVESIKRDKATTEKLLQETIEKHQAELAAQKEYFTYALNEAQEAEALAETRANYEARTELESRLREAEERETTLVRTLEELRQTLSRKEQQAVFREDMLRRDIEDLQKRYQESERRCEELITQVPESTRPLLRQIEAMQETNARRAEAWAAVERSLNSRLQEAEAKAAAAEESERSMNERLSQTLSRINVLEAQISCLRAEQTQLSRSIEKERQRAAENRQEYLVAKEDADTHEGRARQLEEELRELRRKHKQELLDALAHRELLQQELEQEKNARLELERTSRLESSSISDQPPTSRHLSPLSPYAENGNMSIRKLYSAGSLSSLEESFFLQASLDSSNSFSERRHPSETTITPYYLKSMTPSTFEATLRQKDGELASYISRLASLESIRDSLAEELVKMTEQCEKLRAEAATLPGLRAELEAIRWRHHSALELMGERDEELEELRADIVDLKEMYKEQVSLLVNKIQNLSSSGAS
ncbi:golgin candidate 5-like isoform X2 [Telopea speciosissima]|uniref:golgin candidate 5-like isoform X1 n=1 Tax=Telopea speciosissima TaxID=54955 RepID=UPI001CC45031|nr:golgin candidate 5-like isoform X1 [Telopea speciosissima]XP_043724283.1 golgin candidate 5-like isoform X2 [Telopea speciosissima]